jgi:hypothetical protein
MRPARPSVPDPTGGQGPLTVDICRKSTIIGLPFYVAARLVLVTLSLTSLRSLPPGAFKLGSKHLADLPHPEDIVACAYNAIAIPMAGGWAESARGMQRVKIIRAGPPLQSWSGEPGLRRRLPTDGIVLLEL